MVFADGMYALINDLISYESYDRFQWRLLWALHEQTPQALEAPGGSKRSPALLKSWVNHHLPYWNHRNLGTHPPFSDTPPIS